MRPFLRSPGLLSRAAASGPFGNHATLGSKIIAHWRLNETSGTRVDAHSGGYDMSVHVSSGYDTGVLANAAVVSNTGPKAYYAADAAGLSFGDVAFAISGWHFYQAQTWNESGIMAKISTSGTGASYVEYELFFDKVALRYKWQVSNGTTMNTVAASTFGAPSVNTWYFLYCYHDPTANTLGISINNGAIDTAAHSAGCVDGSNPLWLGMGSGGYPNNGRVDSFSLWNSVLSSSEVADLYNSGAGLDY